MYRCICISIWLVAKLNRLFSLLHYFLLEFQLGVQICHPLTIGQMFRHAVSKHKVQLSCQRCIESLTNSENDMEIY